MKPGIVDSRAFCKLPPLLTILEAKSMSKAVLLDFKTSDSKEDMSTEREQ
jgi:hypothetical protein